MRNKRQLFLGYIFRGTCFAVKWNSLLEFTLKGNPKFCNVAPWMHIPFSPFHSNFW